MAKSHPHAVWVPTDADLSRALEQNEFEVFYQPIVELRSRRLVGAEALMRWRHPEHGLLSPGRFVDCAEACGLDIPISEWIQWTACRQAQAWFQAGFDLPILGINF